MAERPGEPGSAPQDCWTPWRNVLALLRAGFSLDDVRRMAMRDFIAFTDLAHSGSAPADAGPREATQADIDRLLS